jgi:hypothetical protein
MRAGPPLRGAGQRWPPRFRFHFIHCRAGLFVGEQLQLQIV